MTQVENPVDAAIRKAQEMAAKAASPTQIDVVPVQAQQGVTTYAPVKAPSLMGLTQGAMSSDGFLKVKEFGLLLLGKPNLVESITVAMVPSRDILPYTGIRYKVGQTVVYKKSYDGVTCNEGGPWAEAVAEAQRIEPGVRTYEGADLAMRLLEDAKDAKGAVVAEAGLVIGHSTSVTNRGLLAEFIKEAMKQEAMDDELEVQVGYVPKTNKAGQTWGLVTFKILKNLSRDV